MYRNETSAIFLGVCVALAACDKTPAGYLTGPEPAVSEAAGSPRVASHYITISLGTGRGGASGINNQGQVVGSFRTPDNAETHVFLWQGGVFRDIGTLGGDFAVASAINAAGQVVGMSSIASDESQQHAFLWENGTWRDLGTLGWTGPLNEPASWATGINATGQVVGWSWTATGNIRAFRWAGGMMRRLPGLERISGKAHGIENNGRVVGEFGESSTRGFRWNAGTVRSLGTFGGSTSIARAINDGGQVVGSAGTASGSEHAFLWRGGVMTNLGTLGGSNSGAYAINGAGQVVGESDTPSGFPPHAFIWENSVMFDLGQGVARGINGAGWVVGAKIDPAVSGHLNYVPTLWKPTDTPPPPRDPGLVRVGSNFFASDRNGTWNPAVDTVASGRTVTWDWFGGNHSVQSVGSPSFTSSALMSGADASYTFTFSRAGTYRYNCVRHPGSMSGRIIVR